MYWLWEHKWHLVWCSAFLLMSSLHGMAQEPEKTRPLPGITVKSCEVQGTMVAQSLGLTASQTTSLIEAYMRARESVMVTRMQLAQYTGMDYHYIRQRMQEERKKLEATLRKILSPDQTQKAIVLLGSFFRQWDAMAMILDGMPLEAKARAEANRSLLRYVAESDPIVQEADSNSELEAVRRKVAALKQNLDNELLNILTEDQMNKWLKGTERSTRNASSDHRRGGRPQYRGPAPENEGDNAGS